MYAPHTLEHLKQQKETMELIGAMDGWDKFKYFASQVGMAVGLISVLYFLEPSISGWVFGIIIIPIGAICALIFYLFAALLETIFG
ncbi:MAG: hypothetical protein P1P90_04270 [Patescibacteria group bacterium]|nr:hypothetical protein [Patescibacteria group bacterium]